METNMKYFSIDKIHGKLFTDDKIVLAENSKQAIEKLIGKKCKRISGVSEINAEYSVVECDEKGRLHYDRRKWNYYGLLPL